MKLSYITCLIVYMLCYRKLHFCTDAAALSKIKWHTIHDEIDEDDYYALLCLPDGQGSTEEEVKMRRMF